MKMRYFMAVYTLVFGVLLFSLLGMFQKEVFPGRDMVYYNEQSILAAKGIEEGKTREEIWKAYHCQVLFFFDKDYQIKLQDAVNREGLVLDYLDGQKLLGKFVFYPKESSYNQLINQVEKKALAYFFGVYLLGCVFFGFLYIWLIRPFLNLQDFARQVAKGNLDFPLKVKKYNYFGAFTESFDLMREELKRARESEYQANISKKELVAELSHDIKTPVATIEAACEVMQVKEKEPEIQKKVALILSKAKIIEKLVGNLFHATLEELTALKVEPIEESSLCIMENFKDLQVYGEIQFASPLPECMVYMDKLRFSQVVDNCMNNAWKYAKTRVQVDFSQDEEGIRILIKDFGEGVPGEDLPKIVEKFYRGSNAKGKEGSGLGLYLAKMFMEQMGGGMEYYNQDGFVVELFLKKV